MCVLELCYLFQPDLQQKDLRSCFFWRVKPWTKAHPPLHFHCGG